MTTKAIDARLARLEARRSAQTLPAAPSYLVGRDLDDLAAQVLALRAQGFTGLVNGYIGVSPEDWDDPGP